MPEDAVVAEPAKTDTPNVDTVEIASTVADTPSSATPAEPEKFNVTDPSTGQSIPVTEDERDWLAQQGLAAWKEREAAGKAAAANPEPVEPKAPEPVAADESGDDDPTAKRMTQLETQIQSVTAALKKGEDREEQRQAVETANGQKASRQRMIDNLAKQHGLEGADPTYRKMVEHRADDLADEALATGQVVTYADCHKRAASEVGDRVAEGARSRWEGKKKVRENAAEPSAGASAAQMAPPKFATTKAEERALSAEMADGSITVRANERFKKIMAGSGV